MNDQPMPPRDLAAVLANEIAAQTRDRQMSVEHGIALGQVYALMHIGDALDRLAQAVVLNSNKESG